MVQIIKGDIYWWKYLKHYKVWHQNAIRLMIFQYQRKHCLFSISRRRLRD
ncbi:unnamed protein product [Paramecium octaurelia]|uniref:Uncharacterized protein n=1 Tax=Paramecium octaurelia TaxID=43137 RepID=A0A8S1XBI1_PAROT|nr:unnamed protein product [Paramecium octaurelia]